MYEMEEMEINEQESGSLLEQIKAVASAEDMQFVSAIIRAIPGKMPAWLQNALVDKLDQMNQESKQDRMKIISILAENGVEYPLTDWLTPKNYAAKFGLKNVETVLNWINRGIIPADHVKEIPELGLRLVKAVEYSPRPYAASSEAGPGR